MTMQTRKRLTREVLNEDQIALQRVSELGSYIPSKSELSIEALRSQEAAMIEARQAEDRAWREAEAARERAIIADQVFHAGVKELRVQIRAQFGENALELHAVGLKRRSERKPPLRRARAG